MSNKGGWRNWGDHPVVVIIASIGAILSIIAFFRGSSTSTDSTPIPEPSKPVVTSPPPTIPSPPPPTVPSDLDKISLESARAVDYRRLKSFLVSREWEEADEETRTVMLQAADRVQENRFDRVSLLNFPCEDLRTIDALWTRASYGKFGFSIQNKIWQSANGLPSERSYSSTIINHAQFSERVGWHDPLDLELLFRKQWYNYTSLSFHVAALDAPTGQLPAYAFFRSDGTSERNEDHISLMIRFSRCGTESN